MDQETQKIRKAVGIIINNGNAWILQQRSNKDGILWPGKIGLWGGAMEAQDEGDYQKTMFRELEEETGLKPEQVTAKCFGSLSFERQTFDHELVNQIIKLYVVELGSGTDFHVSEGISAYELAPNPDPSTYADDRFAAHTTEAIEKLKNYYANSWKN